MNNIIELERAINNNINQFKISGEVDLAPGTNHLIQSISHRETGDLIVYTNKVFLSDASMTNSLIEFINDHLLLEGNVRRMLIITPSKLGCGKLRELIEANGVHNISVYYTSVMTTNFVIEKKNVLFGVENLLEHSNVNCPSVTIKDKESRKYFIEYIKKLIKYANPIIKHTFDEELLQS